MNDLRLSRDALVVLATQEAAFPAAKDALDRFSYLVGPLFQSVETGKQVTAPIVQEIVEQHIGLRLPPPVAEALMFRMANNGYINSEKVGEAKVFFAKGDTDKRSNDSVIDNLITDFRLFVDDKSLLPQISDDEVLQLFMSKVFEISDLLNEKEFYFDGNKFEKWKISIISDYIMYHTDEDGNLPPLLSKLSELCLLRTLVGNMTQQKKHPMQSKLVAVLDAPIALHATGVSGKHSKKSIDATISLAKSIGVRFAIYPTSVVEMKRVLSATLSTDHRDRRGLTARAIRCGDVSETVADDVCKNPDKYIKEFGIATIVRSLVSFPNDEHFFPQNLYKEFSAVASSWSKTEAGESHDSECLTLTMRVRKGHHMPNILGNNYVFVTNNWKFSNAARKKCIEYHMINDGLCSPVIHLNTFSASVWLAGGFKQDARIPEKTLLAACERVLSNVGNVVEKTEQILRELQLEDERTIELLVQDRDSVTAIVSQTAGDPSLINEENIAVILAEAKAAVAKEQAELVKTRDQQIMDMKRKENAQIKNIIARVENLNKQIKKHGWGSVEWFSLVFFSVASILTAFQLSFLVGLIATLFGLFFVTLSYLEIWFPKSVKTWVFLKIAKYQLKKEFSSVEIKDWKIEINDDAEAIIYNSTVVVK